MSMSQTANALPTPASAVSPGRKVNRSCLECTRRKIKCDSRQPCGSCIYNGSPEKCAFRQRSKRNAVSRSTFDKANDELRSQAQILETLFPGYSTDYLKARTRCELLDLLNVHSTPVHTHILSQQVSPLAQAHIQPKIESEPGDDEEDDSAPVSENGEAPVERQWDESLDKPATVASDDINAIGLATDQRARSYLGVTSMSAVFRAIFRLCPMSKEHTAQCAMALSTIQAQTMAPPVANRDLALGHLKEQRCIDFYFEHVHAIMPLLDEQDFRQSYASGERGDASWIGLLNMVLCLGSIASGSDSLHEQYYRTARSYVDLDCLGTGNLDGLQALCLLGGLYLHYRNSPNMAYSVLGAAYRVAIALGLHREPRRCPNIIDPVEAEGYRRRTETRRRTWWSLICLDTWAAMTQGRPCYGRWDATTMDAMLPQPLDSNDQLAISLQASTRFCLILDRIEHRFAQFGRLTSAEISAFDMEIEGWYASLPTLITDTSISSPRLTIAREFMRTRYHGIRLILARSAILYVANDCGRKNEQAMPELQAMLIGACQLAAAAIDSISLYWTPNRIHIWNSGWYLFQACTLPLLCTAISRNVPQCATPETVATWQASICKALETFREMRPWMRASDKSPDIVNALYEALNAETGVSTRTSSATDGSLDLFEWYGEQLNWSEFLGDENLTQNIFPVS